MKLIPESPNIPFMKNRFILLAISAVALCISIFSFVTKGLNFGTDFRGGVKLEYRFPKVISEGEVRRALKGLKVENISVVRFGDPEERRFVIKTALPENMDSFSSTITSKLEESFGAAGLLLEKEETVGPKSGKELRKKGLLAVLFSLFCMLVYVGFRFDFQFAPGALLALFHDVLIVLGVFSVFQLEFDLTILAACLTVVGYSLNDTIVIFDRVREHARLITPDSVEEVVNTSINETLSRTLITSLTTLFVVVVLYLFGGATIRDFALALIVGVITGTYSTLTVACACYLGMYRLAPKLTFLTGKR